MTQQMRQDQDMHTSTNKRPFFSIVVPCYNSRETIGNLLDSIVKQKMQKEDIQVILSDDCSTESYQDIVDQFTDKLFITQVKTDYNCCPGNTRQKGADAAIGQWMCFSDHDDEFVLESLPTLKEKIIQNKINTMIYTKFLKKTKEGQFLEMPSNAGWTHGKFFNLDNFWKKYNVHYIKDLTSHEDVCICSQTEYLRLTYKLDFYTIDLFTYVWRENPESLSNRKYTYKRKERVFLDVFFIDYIESTAGTTYMMYQKHDYKNKEFVLKNTRDVMLYSYFYFEFAKDRVPDYLEENCDHVRKYLVRLKEQFNCSLDDLYDYFKFQDKEDYRTISHMAISQTDLILYEFSFREWLQWIWDKKYVKA